MKTLKTYLTGIFVAFISIILTACGANAANQAELGTEARPVRIAVVGENNELWDYLIEELKKDDVHAELVVFTDYTQPNTAVLEGEADLNAFQTKIFLENFNSDKGSDLTNIGDTFISSMGIYSNEYTDVNDIADGSELTIPNDPTQMGRALILLQSAGLIELDPAAGHFPTVDDITANPKNLEITPVDAGQTARSLTDVAAACVNGDYAMNAGLSVTEDAIFVEPVDESSDPYINTIVARPDEKDNEVYKKIVDAYQRDETAEKIKEIYNGGAVAAW